MVISLVFLCCFIVGCQQDERVIVEPKAFVEMDVQTIKDLIAGLNAAFNSADLDRYLSIYADDAVMFPPADPPSVGKEAIRLTIHQWFDEYSFQVKYEVVDVDISGILAIANISFTTTVIPKTGGESVKEKGNWLWV